MSQFRFLELPVELRLLIYDYLCPTSTSELADTSCDRTDCRSRVPSNALYICKASTDHCKFHHWFHWYRENGYGWGTFPMPQNLRRKVCIWLESRHGGPTKLGTTPSRKFTGFYALNLTGRQIYLELGDHIKYRPSVLIVHDRWNFSLCAHPVTLGYFGEHWARIAVDHVMISAHDQKQPLGARFRSWVGLCSKRSGPSSPATDCCRACGKTKHDAEISSPLLGSASQLQKIVHGARSDGSNLQRLIDQLATYPNLELVRIVGRLDSCDTNWKTYLADTIELTRLTALGIRVILIVSRGPSFVEPRTKPTFFTKDGPINRWKCLFWRECSCRWEERAHAWWKYSKDIVDDDGMTWEVFHFTARQ